VPMNGAEFAVFVMFREELQENQPPRADAGRDQVVWDEDGDGSETVTLDGSASSDPDGTIVSYVWSRNGSQVATGVGPQAALSVGSHIIVLEVTDVDGATDSDTVTVRVRRLFQGREWHVAADGTAGGDGSMADPWDLDTAFNHPPEVQPGDVIWIHGGTYGSGGATAFSNRLDGTETAPIVVRGYPGERPIIDGIIRAESGCSWTWFQDLEVMNSQENRTCPSGDRPGGINVVARGISVINCIIHDTGHPAIGFWRTAGDGAEVHGTLLWANGVYDTANGPGTPDNPWTRGSAIYTQNQDGTRFLTDIIVFRNFTNGLKPYTEGGWIDGFHIEGNTSFDNGDWNILCASRDHPTLGLRVVDNVTYRRPTDSARSVRCGYYSTPNEDVEVRGNYFAAGTTGESALYVKNFRDVIVRDNALITHSRVAEFVSGPAETVTWDHNTYRGGSGTPFKADGTSYDFPGWQVATGFDADSSHTSSLPTGVKIVVRPNAYEPGRANVTVCNWDLNASVDVDLSNVLEVGDRYEIRDAQNVLAEPVVSGTWDGGPVSLPMNLTEVAAPIGDVHHIEWRFTHTAPEFAVFVVRRVLEAWVLSLDEGWRLVSIPLRPQNPRRAAVFPANCVEAVYAHDPGAGYFAPDAIEVKRGYWVKVTQAFTRTIVGMRPADPGVPVVTGWNLVGVVGPGAQEPWQPAPDDPPCAAVWEFLPPYRVPENNCHEGRGYWVKSTADVTIFAGGDVVIPLEAEDGTITAPMTTYAGPNASGGQYVASPTGEQGGVAFTVDLPAAGACIVWCRVLAPFSTADSFHVSVDGGPEDIYDVAEGTWSDQWQWTRVNGRDGGPPMTLDPRTFDLAAGEHTFLFRAREADSRLDRLIITNDPAFVPAD